MQAFVINNATGAVPLGKMFRLPQGFIMDSGATLSSIFDPTKRTETTAPITTAIPVANLNYNYYEVQFYPNGSPDLSPPVSGTNQNWFLTIHNASAGDGLPSAPKNFWTIQIDPYNGVCKYYLP